MADVDAIRHLASEHDLEFVDLEYYGVDPAASEILPAEVARQHHMAAIKRKFGTPVIATSQPDDLDAREAVRIAIGRDFISVVASEEQITDYPRSNVRSRRERRISQVLGAEERKKSPPLEPENVVKVGDPEAIGRNLVELEVEELGAVATIGTERPTARPTPAWRMRPRRTEDAELRFEHSPGGRQSSA